jgi:hypothetical protein
MTLRKYEKKDRVQINNCIFVNRNIKIAVRKHATYEISPGWVHKRKFDDNKVNNKENTEVVLHEIDM